MATVVTDCEESFLGSGSITLAVAEGVFGPSNPAVITNACSISSQVLRFFGFACKAMLRMKEMSRGYAEAFHVAEVRHGPVPGADDQTLVVGLLADRM